MSQRPKPKYLRFLLTHLVLLVLIGMHATPLWGASSAAVLPAPLSVIAPGCRNLIDNGDFEMTGSEWQFVPSAINSAPVSAPEFPPNGSARAGRLGLTLLQPNVPGTSEIRYKSIRLPNSAVRLILRFQYAPFYEPSTIGLNQDVQRVQIVSANNTRDLMNVYENDQMWKLGQFSLADFAGQEISLRFQVTNDGLGGRTWMYIDNVEIEYCPIGTPLPPPPTWTPVGPPTATFTPLPTPTATNLPFTPTPLPPPPEGCMTNIVQNGTFETEDGWLIGEDPNPPAYVINQHHEGARARLLGHAPETSMDWTSYSSIRQLVTIPSNVQRAELRWWHLYGTQQAVDPNPSGASDRQEVMLLTTSGRHVLKLVQRVLRNETGWVQDAVDVSAFRGQSFYLYFNVFNDGNNLRTWAYLDEVMLNICYGPATSTPLPPPTVDAAATAAQAAQQTQVAQALMDATMTAQTLQAQAAATATAETMNQAAVAAAATAAAATQTALALTPQIQQAPPPQAQLLPPLTATPESLPAIPEALLPVTVEPVTVEANFDYLAATATAAALSVTVRLVPPKIISTYNAPGWLLGLGTLAVLAGILVAIVLLADVWRRLSASGRLILALLLIAVVVGLSWRFLRSG